MILSLLQCNNALLVWHSPLAVDVRRVSSHLYTGVAVLTFLRSLTGERTRIVSLVINDYR